MRLGRLFGRDQEVRSLVEALAAPGCLVTLTGLPGSGRTSLAHAAAQQIYPELTVVEGRRAGRAGELDVMLEGHAAAPLLLIDDVDHAPGARDAIRFVRRTSPDLRLLLISSAPLGLPDERIVRLLPLPLPDPTADPRTLRQEPAVQLFLDVAARTGAPVADRDSAVTSAAHICGLLGGVPLAIQLVAARTASYSTATLATLLTQSSLAMLRPRGVVDEGQEHDLVAAVVWSISLLPPGQEELLRALAVFRGPVDLDVVARVHPGPDLVDELSALVDIHLVDPIHRDDESLFALPPLVRDYLWSGRHTDTGTGTDGPPPLVRERHRRWALDLAGEAVALDAAGQLRASRRVVAPHAADLVSALEDALVAGDATAACTLALALLPLVFARATTPEVCRTVDEVLSLLQASDAQSGWLSGRGGPPRAGRADRSDRLTLAAWRELLRAEIAESTAEVSSVVPVLDALRDRAREIDERTLLRVTFVAVQAARSLVERSLAESWAMEGVGLATQVGDTARRVRLETWIGMLAHQRGDHEGAARWGRQALDRARALDDPTLALAPAGLLRGLPADAATPEVLRGVPTADQLVHLARDLGDLRALDWLEPTAAFVDLRAGVLDDATEHSVATLRRARASGARLRAGPPLLCLFLIALQRGELSWAGRLQGILGRYVDVLRPALPTLVTAAYERGVLAYETAAAAHPRSASDVMWGAQLSWDAGLEAALSYAASTRALPSLTGESGARPTTPQGHDRVAGREGGHDRVAGREGGHDRVAGREGAHDRVAGREGAPPRPVLRLELTPREQQVLEQLAAGGTNREISVLLGISAKTVMHHTSNIYRKLAVRGRAEAVAWHLRAHDELTTTGPSAPGTHRFTLVRGEGTA